MAKVQLTRNNKKSFLTIFLTSYQTVREFFFQKKKNIIFFNVDGKPWPCSQGILGI